MQSAHLEKIFYHYIETRPELGNEVKARYFDNPSIRLAHQIRDEFLKKFAKAPTSAQLKEIVKIKNLDEDLSNAKIDALYEVNMTEYDPDWLQATAEAWVEFKTLDTSVMDLVEYMKTTKVNEENIKEVVQTAKSIISERNNVDFKFDEGLDFFDPGSHKQIRSDTFDTGYPYFNTCLGGGYKAKTLVCFAGIPKVGKSLTLGCLGAQAVRTGHNVAYISFEMSDRSVIKRMACNLLNIKSKEYDSIGDDEFSIKQKLSTFAQSVDFGTPGTLSVKEFPTSTASTIDVENWLLRMEDRKGIKYKLVVVDYVGIMKNWRNPNSENTYMKIKQIAEDLRAMAMRNGWCVLTASQFNRGAYNSNDVVLEQIAESAALIHTVDALMGIIQDELMYMNNEYFFKALALRSEGGKNSKKKFNVSYDYLRITEDENSEIIYKD